MTTYKNALVLTARAMPGDAVDVAIAIVELTPDFLELVEKRVALTKATHAQDDRLYSLEFWSYTCNFFENVDVEDVLDPMAVDVLANREWVFRREIEIDEESALRTECDCMVIPTNLAEQSVHFTAYVDNCDVTVETTMFSVDTIRDLLKTEAA